MMQLRLVFVFATLCALSSNLAAASTFQLRPDPHIVGSNSADEPTKPVILKFDLLKDGVFSRSCYGTQLKPPKRRLYTEKDTYWILPAECVDKTKYDMLAVKHGYKDCTHARFYLQDVFYRIHPDYDVGTKAHNIAFVSLPFPTKLDLKSGYINVQLPSETDNFDNKTLELFEYKDITTDKEENELLWSVKTEPIKSFWCKILYPFSPIKNFHTCVSGLYGKGLSKGDLGAPLIARDGNTFKLVGLATIIRPWTSLVSFPIEVLRIQPYMKWIKAFSGER